MIQIIPAIDIIDGKCVRLTHGDYALKTIYNDDPLEVAKNFESIGITRLHLVDLDGAKKGAVVNLKVLEKLASKTKLKIDFGGGIKTDIAMQSVFDAGAYKAAIGSIAVKNKDMFLSWISRYGADKIFLGADVRKEYIAISGWLEQTELSVFDFIADYRDCGINKVFCTDISKDGELKGPSFAIYKKILEQFPDLELTASGGVSSLADIDELELIGCKGVIIGKAIYEGRFTIYELKKYLQ